MNKLSRSKLIMATICFAGLSVGFADCSREAGEVRYKVIPCPPKTFQWPLEAQDSVSEIKKEPFRGRSTECRKLIRYAVKLQMNPGDPKSKWSTFDAYLGILNSNSCQLVIAIGLAGPKAPDSVMRETISKLANRLPGLVFAKTPYQPAPSPERISVIGSSKEAKKWCDNLPIESIVDGS